MLGAQRRDRVLEECMQKTDGSKCWEQWQRDYDARKH
jgi:hypothetical protein